MHQQSHEARNRRQLRLVACVVLALAVTPAVYAESPAGETAAVTLPADEAVLVDVRATEHEAEQAAARQRAAMAAALPGAAEREASVPEILLIQRKVLANMLVVSARPDGPAQSWRVRSSAPPAVFAERVIVRLMLAGFSTTPGCPGEEWSGKHGNNRVAVRVEQRAVAVLLTPASTPCADDPRSP